MQRLFAAIPLIPEPPLLELLAEGERIFRHEKVRWVNPQQLHLTMKFFGETPGPAIELIASRFREKTSVTPPFRFTLQGAGMFGSRYQPRVVWAGTRNDLPLRTLGESLLDAAEEAGFPRDRLPFVPHLTLARITHIARRGRLQAWLDAHRETFLQEVAVASVTLFESILKPTGAVYAEVERFPLSSSS